MRNLEDKKATLAILGIAAILIIIIVVPIVLLSGSNDKNSFPLYSDLNIKEKDVEDVNSESYIAIKNRLETDYYFAKESLISNYSSKSYTSVNLKDMIWNFIFSYELTNKKNTSSINMDVGKFCLSNSAVINAFEELYGVRITKEMEYLPTFHEYVNENEGRYCFDFKKVASDYNNTISVGIDAISVKKGIVTTNVYVYEYYTLDSPEEIAIVSKLNSSIISSNFNEAKRIVEEELNGDVTHKQLEFKINNGGKYFKYQILSSKNLVY